MMSLQLTFFQPGNNVLLNAIHLRAGLGEHQLVVAAVMLAAASPAHASTQPNITCGEVISASATLTSNLTCVGTAFSTTGTEPIIVDLAETLLTSTTTWVSTHRQRAPVVRWLP